MTEMTGILMEGKMSFGVRRMASTPAIKMKIANTMKVYGLRSARLTIHIVYSPDASCKSADFASSALLAISTKADFAPVGLASEEALHGANRSLSRHWNNIGCPP